MGLEEAIGSTSMRLLATRKAHQNLSVVDPWSVVHFSTGLALGLLDAPLRWVLPAAVAYEVAEQVFERHESGQIVFRTSGPEIALNAVFDTAIFAVGHWLGQRWNAN